ncbi:MAG: CDP-glycerol glycerophosphotransferase family protein [Candidatus Omnitrophica bacterium]|nr:CDP-glycerol glycerophosphotransferase family protein [Candidatus Omnitrophota bacterium]
MRNLIIKNKYPARLKKQIGQFLKDSENPVFFIHTQDNLADFIRFIKEIANLKKDALFVCINSSVPYYYADLGLNFKAIDEYMDIADYESIDKFVYSFTKNWYLSKDGSGQAITQQRGIHLGSIVEYDFQLFLIRRLKWFKGMHKITRIRRPDRVVVIENTGELLEPAELLDELLHIPLFRIYQWVDPIDTFSMRRNLKAFMVDAMTGIVDFIVRSFGTFILKEKIIIDSRVYLDLAKNLKMPKKFLPTPFEKGLKMRLGLIKSGFCYLPFYFPQSLHISKKCSRDSYAKYLGDMIYYEGVSIEKLIKTKIDKYLTYDFPVILRNIRMLERFLKNKSVKAIVLRHDLWELQKTCVLLAKRLQVPTIVIQHGIFGEKGEEIVFADKIAVWGRLCSQIYEALGTDPAKCFVTGNPRLDAFYNQEPKFSRQEVCRMLGLGQDKKTLLLASGLFRSFLSSYMTGDENNVIIYELIRIMKELPQYQLIIKLHPYENALFSEEVVKYLKVKNVSVVKNFDLLSLINSCDLFVTKRSSLGLKAMVLDKPVIVVNFEKRKEINPYVRSGVALEIDNPQDMLKTIVEALENPEIINKAKVKSRIFIQDYAYNIDGLSSERVLNFIEEAVSHRTFSNQ